MAVGQSATYEPHERSHIRKSRTASIRSDKSQWKHLINSNWRSITAWVTLNWSLNAVNARNISVMKYQLRSWSLFAIPVSPTQRSGVWGHTSISKARSSPKNSFCIPIPKITVATSATLSMACNACVSFSAWQYYHRNGHK